MVNYIGKTLDQLAETFVNDLVTKEALQAQLIIAEKQQEISENELMDYLIRNNMKNITINGVLYRVVGVRLLAEQLLDYNTYPTASPGYLP